MTPWRRTSYLQGPQMHVGMIKMIMEGGVLREEAMSKGLSVMPVICVLFNPFEYFKHLEHVSAVALTLHS